MTLPVPKNKELYLTNAVAACCFVLMVMQGKTKGRGLNKLHIFWKEESLRWPPASGTPELCEVLETTQNCISELSLP